MNRGQPFLGAAELAKNPDSEWGHQLGRDSDFCPISGTSLLCVSYNWYCCWLSHTAIYHRPSGSTKYSLGYWREMTSGKLGESCQIYSDDEKEMR